MYASYNAYRAKTGALSSSHLQCASWLGPKESLNPFPSRYMSVESRSGKDNSWERNDEGNIESDQ